MKIARGILLVLVFWTAGCSIPFSIIGQRKEGYPPVAKSHTVLFVHGMSMTPLCWENWEPFFQKKGYKTMAPPWPEHAVSVDEQRKRHPYAPLAALTLEQVVDHYRKIIRGLDEKPILVGHSMGGLVVQLLLAEGLGAAAVAIDPAPPKGVISLRWSFLKSNWPAVSPSTKLDKPTTLSFEDFQYSRANTLPRDLQRAQYDRYIVPESMRIWKGPGTQAAVIDYRNPRPPLLIIAGEKDRIIPASLNLDKF
jgi:pimeloyl-ACP methyl ester carboxylesterase